MSGIVGDFVHWITRPWRHPLTSGTGMHDSKRVRAGADIWDVTIEIIQTREQTRLKALLWVHISAKWFFFYKIVI